MATLRGILCSDISDGDPEVVSSELPQPQETADVAIVTGRQIAHERVVCDSMKSVMMS